MISGPAFDQTRTIDTGLLGTLLHSAEPLSLAVLAARHGLSMDRLHAELAALRQAGCRFDEHPQYGLGLTEAGLGTWAEYLRAADRARAGRAIEVYRRTGSTQDAARQLVRTYGQAADGGLVAASAQTAGRGRFGRAWAAPEGRGVAVSRISVLGRLGEQEAINRLTFASAVAVAETVEPLLPAGSRLTLKWPNDVLVDGRKLAGILVEAGHEGDRLAAVVGIGLNVHLRPDDLPDAEPELAERVTSLAMAGVRVDRLAVLARLVGALDEVLEVRAIEPLLEAWRFRCDMLHRPVRLRSGGQPISGQVEDLDPEAGLIVRTDGGQLVHLPAATTSVE